MPPSKSEEIEAELESIDEMIIMMTEFLDPSIQTSNSTNTNSKITPTHTAKEVT
jgi:hypothetical protein